MNDARIELGRSGLRVAPICIGTWQLSGAWGRDTSQAAAAVTLINAIPKPPTLATEGSLGTKINTFA